jgi:hypothetical protein
MAPQTRTRVWGCAPRPGLAVPAYGEEIRRSGDAPDHAGERITHSPVVTPAYLRMRPRIREQQYCCSSGVISSKRPQGLKSVRENWCRPYGTRTLVPLYPALPCRAFTCRRYAAESALIVLHVLSDQLVLTHTLKPGALMARAARLKACPFKVD